MPPHAYAEHDSTLEEQSRRGQEQRQDARERAEEPSASPAPALPIQWPEDVKTEILQMGNPTSSSPSPTASSPIASGSVSFGDSTKPASTQTAQAPTPGIRSNPIEETLPSPVVSPDQQPVGSALTSSYWSPENRIHPLNAVNYYPTHQEEKFTISVLLGTALTFFIFSVGLMTFDRLPKPSLSMEDIQLSFRSGIMARIKDNAHEH